MINNNIKSSIISEIDKELRGRVLEERVDLKEKLYLSQIIDLEKPVFESNNLILAPVGSGKSQLIESRLIPEDYSGSIIYLVSNTTLKDSICPNNNVERERVASEGKSQKMFTTSNRKRYGSKPYNIHVMSYHEFGDRIFSPQQTLTKDVGLIFCDEIHSLPVYHSYDKRSNLAIAMNFLFSKHEDIKIYYFTATSDSLDKLESEVSGYFGAVTSYNYLEHPKIRKYVARSTYFVSNVEEIRPHLKAKLAGFDYYKYKGLAFSKLIADQEKIAAIVSEEGYKPIVLWSVNNEREMSEEQLRVREYILRTGLIPNEYNFLIINGAMQEGWSLHDPDMTLAIMDTTDVTEQVQALGRIRKDIELLICKAKSSNIMQVGVEVPEEYIDVVLTTELKDELCGELNVLRANGKPYKWTTISKMIMASNYELVESIKVVDGRRRSCAVISLPRIRVII